MVTEIPASEWRKLIDIAQKFLDAAPWEWIQDTQVFGIADPASMEEVHCSVMGNSGELKALAMYPGKLGWKSYLAIGSEELDTDPTELVYGQRCIIVSWENPQDLESDDLVLLQSLGIAIEDKSLLPSFRSYRPGYLPMSPDHAEVKLMQVVVAQALALIADLPGASEILPEEGLNEQGELLFREKNAHDWQLVWRRPPSTLDFSPPTISLEQLDIADARRLPQQEAIWLLEDFHLPEPVLNENEQPFFPRALIFFDLEVQEFRGVSLLEPEDFPEMVGMLLLEMIAQQGMTPTQIVVSQRSHLILVRPLCQALGVGIHLEADMDIVPALREAVQEMMADVAQ